MIDCRPGGREGRRLQNNARVAFAHGKERRGATSRGVTPPSFSAARSSARIRFPRTCTSDAFASDIAKQGHIAMVVGTHSWNEQAPIA